MPKTNYGNDDTVKYQFCIHNDADDPSYYKLTPNGETSDADDPNHFITIEGYGFYGKGATPLASVRIAATVSVPKTSAVLPTTCYSQEGGCGQKLGNAGALEGGITINTATTKAF
jgi:hypothetical protein